MTTQTTTDSTLERHLNKKVNKAYLNKLLAEYIADVSKSDTEANATDRALSGQLILITTVLITANIVIFSNDKLLTNLAGLHQGLILTGLALLIISLVLGIIYYDKVKKFHKDWAAGRDGVVRAMADFQVKTYGDLRKVIDDNVENRLNPNINERFLKLQIWVLIGALVVYFLLAVALLLDIRSCTSHFPWLAHHC